MTSEWKELELADVAELIRGVSYKPNDLTNADDTNSVSLLRATNIGEKQLELKEVLYVPAALVKPTQLLKKFDIVIAMSSGSRSAVGRLAQLRKDFDGTFGAFCGAIRPKSDAVDPEFLGYVLYSPQFRNRIDTYASGTAIMNLTKEGLLGFPINLPPKKLQKKISDLLGAIDDRITLLRETNQTLEAIAQALFKSWFVDFDPVRAKADGRVPDGIDAETAALFPNAFEESELRLVPKGWADATLSTVATFQNGYAFKSSDWSEVGHPVVKIGNVKPLHIDFDGCSYVSPQTVVGLERFKLSAGDLLVGMTGYVGETGLVPHSETASYLNQRVGRIMTKNGLRDLGFVFSAVRQKEFKNFAESQSHGSAQANVSGADLMKFPVTVPSTDVLEKYNEITYQFIASILSNHSEASLLTSLRDTLLPRLISGQLPIADAETELEKALA